MLSSAKRDLNGNSGEAVASLQGLYWRNLVPIPLSYLIVLCLNVFTPLEFFDELRTILLDKSGWIAVATLIVLVLSSGGIIQYLSQRPIAAAWNEIRAGSEINSEMRESAQRRLLNLPYILGVLNLSLLTVLPALMLIIFCYFAGLSQRSAVFIFFRVIVVALISTTFSFFWVEAFLRRHVVPRLFPLGRLAAVSGTMKTSIGVRIRILYIAGTIVPMAVLLGTLLLGLWSPKIHEVSGVEFGRQVIIFSSVLFGIFIIVALRLNSLVVKSVTGIIDEMLTVMASVRAGNFSQNIRVVSNDELGILGDGGNDMIAGLSEREKIRDAFGKYVTPEIRDEILAGRIPLSGIRTEATMLFCDLRNFTPFVEENDPEEVIMSMRAYFTAMQRAISNNSGLVLQYVGDEIEAVFGVPLFYEDHADKAVLAALEMRTSLDELNEQRRQHGKPPFENGIGIHTGGVLAGNTGSDDRLSYALIGSTVNVASRIQGLTKEVGCNLLISEETKQHLKESFPLETKGTHLVKGYSRPISLYSVLNTNETDSH